KELGLRDPIPIQYARFLYDLAKGDLGRSYLLNESDNAAPSTQNKLDGQITAKKKMARDTKTVRTSVLKLIGDGLPYTLQLTALDILFTALLALPLGIAGGLKPNGWQDRIAFLTGSLFVSIPNFWLALVLILLISSRANLLPSIGYKSFA